MNLDEMVKKFGNSTAVSRQVILDAFDNDIENIKQTATEWAKHHNISGSPDDIFVAFATALDMGGRIAQINN